MFNIRPLTFVRGGEPEKLLSETRRDGLWRPTAVALLQHNGQYCVTTHLTNKKGCEDKPCKYKLKPDLPKGGIDPGESVIYALKRELWEEVCFSARYIVRINYLGYTLVPFDESNMGRDGYGLGKLYFIYNVIAQERLVRPNFAHNVVSTSWTERVWEHFKPGSKKYKIFSQSTLLNLLN